MGEKQNGPFQLSCNASLKVDFQGSRVTSDGGRIWVREMDEWLGFGEPIDRRLVDRRQGKTTQFPLADLLRQLVYSRLAGYENVNDAERLSQDPTFRSIKHARYYWLLLAEGPLTRRLFGAMVRRIEVLPVPAGDRRPQRRFKPAEGRKGAGEVYENSLGRNRMNKTAPKEVGGCMVEGGQEAILQILVETGYHSCLTTLPISQGLSAAGAGNAHARRARMHK